MDNSHVSLVSVNLRADGFDKYRYNVSLKPLLASSLAFASFWLLN